MKKCSLSVDVAYPIDYIYTILWHSCASPRVRDIKANSTLCLTKGLIDQSIVTHSEFSAGFIENADQANQKLLTFCKISSKGS